MYFSFEIFVKNIVIDNTRISYIDKGKGQIILFIHGLFFPKEGFIPLIEILSKNYRCIALDLPGFGQSDAIYSTFSKKKYINIINRFVNLICKRKKIVLFGSSLGGFFSILYAHVLSRIQFTAK
jgi:pimeloyl-ACP methyl ester carboxylesterase